MLTPEQIEARAKGVGCSEVMAAAGKDPRCSRLELYKRKVGELPPPDFSKDQRVEFGNELEPLIRNVVARRLKQEIFVPEQTMRHESAPLVGHPDGLFAGSRQGLEIKTCDKFEADEFGEEGTDQIPIRYLIQCQGYMVLTGAKSWKLAVLIGGNDLRIYEVPFDPKIADAVLTTVRGFWNGHVAKRLPPDPATPEDVKLRWPKDNGQIIVATPEIEQMMYDLAGKRAEWDVMEKSYNELEADIKRFMADASVLVNSEGVPLATWKKAKDGTKLDPKKVELEAPKLYAKLLEPTTGSRRFLVKIPSPQQEP